MSANQIVMLIASLMALLALFWKGGRPERLVGAAVILIIAAPLMVQNLEIGNIKWALALLSVAFCGMLIVMALTSDRRWLLAAAGCQLVATASYGAAFADPDILIYSGVALRRILWLQLMIILVFGAWEASLMRPRRSDHHPGFLPQ